MSSSPTVSHPSHLTVIDSQSAPGSSAEFDAWFASGWREQWLAIDGQRYCFRVLPHPQPAFEPTLFLNGAFQTRESWARFARAFARHATVVLIDPPGRKFRFICANAFARRSRRPTKAIAKCWPSR